MNEKVSVNTEIPSPYIENKGGLYRMKRKLTYAFAFRLLNRHLNKLQELQVLEIGTGSGFFLDFEHEHSPNARFNGVEYDQKLMAKTDSRAPHANLNRCSAENFDLGRGRYDHVRLKDKDERDRPIMAHGFSPLYSGSTFFSGVPVINKLPLGIVNWLLLVAFGSLRWSAGESYVGVFKSKH